MSDPARFIGRLTALSDLARLRMLRLLSEHELSVGELARALQLPQSTVSRHLKLLHEADWITKRTEGTANLYRMISESLDHAAVQLWKATADQIGPATTVREDDRRLAEVMAERRLDSRAFFGQIGGEWDALRDELFGDAFTTNALIGLIPSDWTVADFGCGTGQAAELLAPQVGRVIAIDREPAMLDAARQRLNDHRNVEFRLGELPDPPLEAGEVDAAIAFLVMHHLADPCAATRTIARALKPNGLLLIVDMIAHDRGTYQHTMGHQHLGFDEDTVREWADAAGFSRLTYRLLRPDTNAKGPGLFAATLGKA